MYKKVLWLLPLLLCSFCFSYAQGMLNRTVSVNASRKPLSAVLEDIGRQGNFHFSYIRDFIRDDSLVTLRARNKTVRQVLDMLFQGSCQYKEIGSQVILQRPGQTREKWYVVSGYITDATTGRPVGNASVYERGQLISTLTNEQGYFRLRLRDGKDRPQVIAISVSKELYKDTAMNITTGVDQELKAQIKPATPIQLSIVDVNQFSRVESSWMGRFFVSSRQRVQSLNIGEFFTRMPFQYSLLPGIGTHGKMGAQVVNKVSINILGGYSAGLSGVEVGSIFNIDRQNVEFVQAAGIFNVVGGRMRGMQAAGLYNSVLDSVTGMQAAGLVNRVKGRVKGAQAAGLHNRASAGLAGMQAAGIANHSGGSMQGMQAAGIGNLAGDSVNGAQIAGVFNHSHLTEGAQIAGAGNISVDSVAGGQIAGVFNHSHSTRGLQLAGGANISADSINGAQIAALFNYTGSLHGAQLAVINNISSDTTRGAQVGMLNYSKVLKGLQLGIVNIADSSDGYSIGLVNFVRKGGYRQLLLYNNELLQINLAYKGGNKKLYSLLLAGMQLNGSEKAVSIGAGLGHAFPLKGRMSLAVELTGQYLYLGSWKTGNTLNRLQTALHIPLARGIGLFAGPAFTIYYAEHENATPGYKPRLPGPYPALTLGNKLHGWFGWHIGLSFF